MQMKHSEAVTAGADPARSAALRIPYAVVFFSVLAMVGCRSEKISGSTSHYFHQDSAGNRRWPGAIRYDLWSRRWVRTGTTNCGLWKSRGRDHRSHTFFLQKISSATGIGRCEQNHPRDPCAAGGRSDPVVGGRVYGTCSRRARSYSGSRAASAGVHELNPQRHRSHEECGRRTRGEIATGTRWATIGYRFS